MGNPIAHCGGNVRDAWTVAQTCSDALVGNENERSHDAMERSMCVLREAMAHTCHITMPHNITCHSCMRISSVIRDRLHLHCYLKPYTLHT